MNIRPNAPNRPNLAQGRGWAEKHKGMDVVEGQLTTVLSFLATAAFLFIMTTLFLFCLEVLLLGNPSAKGQYQVEERYLKQNMRRT